MQVYVDDYLARHPEKRAGYSRAHRQRVKSSSDAEVQRIKWRDYARNSRASMTAEERTKHLRRRRLYHLKHLYGLAPGEFEKNFAAQGYRCAICKGIDAKRWTVDHDHSSKAYRGILCTQCNSLLGYARDNSSILRRAINYLRMNNGISKRDDKRNNEQFKLRIIDGRVVNRKYI